MLPVTMQGVVTRFKGNGRRLGYPTANLRLVTDTRDGVYFGYADLAEFKHHPAVIFVGTPTTVGDTERRVEAHLLDIPDKDYYDLELVISLGTYYRPNQTFDSLEALLAAMKDDEIAARRWFSSDSARP